MRHRPSTIPAYEQELRSCEICALTLVELLVAMGIAALLAGVVFSIYAGTLRTLASQNRWRVLADPCAAALETLSSDLSGALAPWGITNPPFVLIPDPEGAGCLSLRLLTAAPVGPASPGAGSLDSGRDLCNYAVREICYSLATTGATETDGAALPRHSLVRAWKTWRLAGPSGVVSNVDVWTGVRALQVEVFDGTKWTNTWGAGTNASLPRAVRIMLSAGNETDCRRIAAEVMVPAAHLIAPPGK